MLATRVRAKIVFVYHFHVMQNYSFHWGPNAKWRSSTCAMLMQHLQMWHPTCAQHFCHDTLSYFLIKKCHQQFVSTFGCQGCSPTSLRNTPRTYPNSFFRWPADGLSAEKKGVLGIGASARMIQEALGGKTSFGFKKKRFHKSTIFVMSGKALRHGV